MTKVSYPVFEVSRAKLDALRKEARIRNNFTLQVVQLPDNKYSVTFIPKKAGETQNVTNTR